MISSKGPLAQQGGPIRSSLWQLEELHTPLISPTNLSPNDDSSLAAVSVLNAERDRLVAEAYDAGYEAGRESAASSDAARIANAVQILRSSAEQLIANESKAMHVLEENVAALAVTIARQIIGREVRTSPDLIIDLVRIAVAEFPVDQPLRIRVNPIDLSMLSVVSDGVAIRIAPDREIAWAADARVMPGGCVVEGRERIIDGRVDTALERVFRTVSAHGA